jgi:hypothetical protein
LPGYNYTFTAEQVRLALRMLLSTNTVKSFQAERRRRDAMDALGISGMSIDTWRKKSELDLMLILARQLEVEVEMLGRIERAESIYYLARNGEPRTSHHALTVTALADGFNHIAYVRQRAPRWRKELADGIDIGVQVETSGVELLTRRRIGTWRVIFPPLRKNQSLTIAWSCEYDPGRGRAAEYAESTEVIPFADHYDQAPWDRERPHESRYLLHMFSLPVDLFSLRVIGHKYRLNDAMVWVDANTGYEDRTPVFSDTGNLISYDFRDIGPDYACVMTHW